MQKYQSKVARRYDKQAAMRNSVDFMSAIGAFDGTLSLAYAATSATRSTGLMVTPLSLSAIA